MHSDSLQHEPYRGKYCHPYGGLALQADAKGAELRSEHQMKALRQTCHTKIQGIQKSKSVQLQTLKVQLCHYNLFPDRILSTTK